MSQGGYVYIMANKRYGVLYIGVTSNLAARIARHREGEGSAFTSRYRCHMLVYVEAYPTIEDAIRREKAMKAWKRQWKIDAIESQNAAWDDLFLTFNA